MNGSACLRQAHSPATWFGHLDSLAAAANLQDFLDAIRDLLVDLNGWEAVDLLAWMPNQTPFSVDQSPWASKFSEHIEANGEDPPPQCSKLDLGGLRGNKIFAETLIAIHFAGPLAQNQAMLFCRGAKGDMSDIRLEWLEILRAFLGRQLERIMGTGQSDPMATLAKLTRTEKKIAMHALSGLSNPEIAKALGCERATVKAHLSNVYLKLGISSRYQLFHRIHHHRSGIILIHTP